MWNLRNKSNNLNENKLKDKAGRESDATRRKPSGNSEQNLNRN